MITTDIVNVNGITPNLKVTFWEIAMKKPTKKNELFSYDYLTEEERKIVDKHFRRKYEKGIEARKGCFKLGMERLRKEFFYQVRKRGPIKEAVRNFKRYLLIWEEYRSNLDYDDVRRIGRKGKDSVAWQPQVITMGRILDNYEQCVIERKAAQVNFLKQENIPKRHDALPLFTCSGELEADSMKADKIAKLARHQGETRRTTYAWKHSDSLDFGWDGGGQPETRFLIDGKFPDIVAGCVSKIGSPEKNGGHIHINVSGREDIGQKVFMGFRYHLSWFRWLVPPSRRHHRWAAVDNTPKTWDEAKGQKAAAISGNTFWRTGTVEIRLWPTSQLASEWRGRAALMKAMARWSLEYPQTAASAITKEIGEAAWSQFFIWAHKRDPEGLRYALRVLRRKGQSSTSDADREACSHLYELFVDSGITVAGFRRRNNISNINKENDNV